MTLSRRRRVWTHRLGSPDPVVGAPRRRDAPVIARRGALATLAFGIVSRPLGVAAQPPPKVPRVGILVPQARSGRLPVDAFVEALRELGYVDGRSVVLEWRYSEGKSERLPALAGELVQLRVDVIHAVGPDAVEVARKTTTTIPIVGVGGDDPVFAGWAASLARPGGNITGLTVLHPGLLGKQLELLKEAVPGLNRVAALFDSDALPPGSPLNTLYVQGMQDPARYLGLQLHMLGVSGASEFEKAFTSAASWRAQALHLNETPLLLTHRARLAELAARTRLPAIAVLKPTAEAGFLMAYGPDVADLHRRAAVYVDKILRGARAGDLPFERPSQFELVINARTARALGLTIPASLLLRANEVIQ